MTLNETTEPISIAEKLKEVLKHSLIYGLASSMQSLVGFLLLPLLTTYYSTELFGVYSIILLVSTLAGGVFYLGGTSALGRYYFEDDTREYRSKIVSTAIFITMAGAFLLIGIALLTGSILSNWLFHTSIYSSAIILSLVGAAAVFLFNIMTLIVRYEKKSIMFFVVSISVFLLNFSITYVLLTKLDFGILAPIYGLLVANLIGFVVLFILYRNLLTLKPKILYFSLLLKFGLPSLVISLLFYILDWVDRLIIKDLVGLSQVGIYSLGYRLGSAINIIFVIPFALIWAPIRMEYLKQENTDEFMTKVVSYYSIVGMSIVFISILFGREVISLVFHNRDYAPAARVFPIVMLSILFYGYQNILDFGIYLHKKLHYYMVVASAGIIVNVVLNFLLIPHFGYIAAAYVTFLTYLFTSSFIHLVSIRYHRIKLERSRIVIPFVFLALSYFVANVNTPHWYWDVGVRLVLVLFAAIGFYFLWLEDQERINLGRGIRKVFSYSVAK